MRAKQALLAFLKQYKKEDIFMMFAGFVIFLTCLVWLILFMFSVMISIILGLFGIILAPIILAIKFMLALLLASFIVALIIA